MHHQMSERSVRRQLCRLHRQRYYCAGVLLMAGELDRRVELGIRDEDEQRVTGATVTFSVNGRNIAEIPSTRDKDPSFQIGDHDAKIGATIQYGTFRQSVVFPQDQDELLITIPGFRRGLGILHLTDLHVGQKAHADLYPSIRRSFFEDIERCHEKAGPWDLIVFSGDLTFSGTPEQFDQVNRFVAELLRRLKKLGSEDPVFLAVPGNHDLSRPADETNPVAVVFETLTSLRRERADRVWTAIVSNPTSEYRKNIDAMFTNYCAWWIPWAKKAKEQLFSFREGLLPGEFAATVKKGDCEFGIVGLNTTFLQISPGAFQGKLAVHVQQFNRLVPDDDADWPENLDGVVLVTHQPPDWLSTQNRKDVFNPLIARARRFAVHLCGHMHVAKGEVEGRGGSDARRVALGRALFALEPIGDEGMERLFGYQAFQISASRFVKDGLVRAWPRKATQSQAENWIFGPDDSFELDSDGGTPDLPSNRFRRPNWKQKKP